MIPTLLLAPLCCSHPSQEARPEPEPDYGAVLEREVAAGVPGVSACIRVGEEEWVGVAGLRSIEDEEPVTPDTAFRMASITKPFTYALVMDLVGAEMFTLEQTLSELLPAERLEGLPEVEHITLLHLLEHRSGLTNFTDLDSYSQLQWRVPGNRSRILGPWELIDLVRGRPARFSPGERFEYCNTGYLLLGLILEQATGASLHELFRERLLVPLEMTETYMDGYETAPVPLASCYQSPTDAAERVGVVPPDMPRLREGGVPVCNLSRDARDTYNAWAFAAGALNGSPRDLARFVGASLLGDCQPWNEATAASMQGGSRTDWNGGSWGIATSVYMDSERDIVVVLYSNGVLEGHNRYQAFHDLIDMALAQAQGGR